LYAPSTVTVVFDPGRATSLSETFAAISATAATADPLAFALADAIEVASADMFLATHSRKCALSIASSPLAIAQSASELRSPFSSRVSNT
jgi:hypothetical protein